MTKRMTLLQRLANIGGLGKREDEAAENANHLRPITKPRDTDVRPAADRRPPEQVSEYLRRPATRGLSVDGTSRPAPGRTDEYELEIPAFLRRQAT